MFFNMMGLPEKMSVSECHDVVEVHVLLLLPPSFHETAMQFYWHHINKCRNDFNTLYYNVQITVLCTNHMCSCMETFLKGYVNAFRMFGMVTERLYLPDLGKVSGHTERKICAVGVTNILTQAPSMLQTYTNNWYDVHFNI